MIDMSDDFQVVRDVSTGQEAITAFNNIRPDIVLLDLMLPDTPGIDVLLAMKDTAPSTPVIVLTSCSDDEPVFSALEYGANAYILKESGAKELFRGMHYAFSGEMFISPKIAKFIVKDYLLINKQRKTAPPWTT